MSKVGSRHKTGCWKLLRATSTHGGERVCRSQLSVLSLYVLRIHTILLYQVTFTIVLTAPFTTLLSWQDFARRQAWMAGIAPIVLTLVYACIPTLRNTSPACWVTFAASTCSESFAVAMTAGVTRSPIFLLTMIMMWINVLTFIALDVSAVYYATQNEKDCVVGRWRLCLSPAVAMATSWVVFASGVIVWSFVTDATLLAKDSVIFSFGCYSDVEVATSLVLSLLCSLFVVAETQWSISWFGADEFIVGSCSLFIGVFALVQTICWYIMTYIATIQSMDRISCGEHDVSSDETSPSDDTSNNTKKGMP